MSEVSGFDLQDRAAGPTVAMASGRGKGIA
jgi:hypothetical protein